MSIFRFFKNHLIQKPKKCIECLKYSALQQNEETIDEYLVKLQTKAEKCGFNVNKEEKNP